MAERRMFAKTIVDSDAFLEMPLSTQALYFHLGMRADDDGFVNSPKKILRMINGQEDDLKLLITKKFVIPFDSGIIVIKHWKINNYIQSDRYHETTYQKEKGYLIVEDNRSYTVADNSCIQDGYILDTQIRIDKNRQGKNRLDDAPSGSLNKFVPPSVDEVRAYLSERSITSFTAEAFCDYYKMCGWTVGKNNKKMKDWKAAVRQWQQRHPEDASGSRVETNARGEILQ